MLLVSDIGNTSITLGIYENENLIETFRLPSDKELPQEEYEILLHTLFKNYNVTACIIASVVDELSLTFKHAVDNTFHLDSMLLSDKLNLGIKAKLKNPKEAGADRIANACGAYVLYPKPAIIVDLGTATTFDILNKDGEFIGGVIMPGLNLQLKALNSCTSKLPKIEITEAEKVIGDNTRDAILSGVIRGSACAIEGLIEQAERALNQGVDKDCSFPGWGADFCTDEVRVASRLSCQARSAESETLGAKRNPRQEPGWGDKGEAGTDEGDKVTIIATGGYSTLISKYMTRQFDFVNPYLTLEGLRFLYELNK